MKQLIGFWIICVAIVSSITLLLYDAELKDKVFMILGSAIFLGMIEIGVYMCN